MSTLEKFDLTEQAEQIIEANVDPNWDLKFGNMIIGVTGKHQVYYTLWKYSPMNRLNQLTYFGNLSTNIVEAAKKAKKVAGIQPIYFDSYENLQGMKGSATNVITFGKYRGKTIGEIYLDDPQYVIWLSKNMTPRNKKQIYQEKIAKDLTDDYFRSLGDKNRSEDTKEYTSEVNDKVELSGTVVDVSSFSDFYGGISYRFRFENYNNRFQFYVKHKSILDFFENDDLESLKNIEISIKGKIKGHKEYVGKKYTLLNYVKFQ